MEVEEPKVMDEQPWDEALEGDFVKWENGEKKEVELVNWKVEQRETPNFDDPSKKEMKWVFSAEVIKLDGKKCEKKIETPSKPFLGGMKAVLQGKDNTCPVSLRVKRIGDGAKTVYDVEEAK